jgi:hypothetical protein
MVEQFDQRCRVLGGQLGSALHTVPGPENKQSSSDPVLANPPQLLFLGLRIDDCACQLRQRFVSGLFLFKRFRQQIRRVLVSEFLRPRNQSAVAQHLGVFDGLCRR